MMRALGCGLWILGVWAVVIVAGVVFILAGGCEGMS